jgi:hypothetical protein
MREKTGDSRDSPSSKGGQKRWQQSSLKLNKERPKFASPCLTSHAQALAAKKFTLLSFRLCLESDMTSWRDPDRQVIVSSYHNGCNSKNILTSKMQSSNKMVKVKCEKNSLILIHSIGNNEKRIRIGTLAVASGGVFRSKYSSRTMCETARKRRSR